jgi:glycosyltransferase involved in cell wall biosynthesis
MIVCAHTGHRAIYARLAAELAAGLGGVALDVTRDQLPPDTTCVFCVWWRAATEILPHLPPGCRLVLGLNDHRSWPAAPEWAVAARRADGLLVSNLHLQAELQARHLPAHLVREGVDVEQFRPGPWAPGTRPGRLRIGWAGDAGIAGKRVDLLRRLGSLPERAGCELVLLDSSREARPRDQMPAWYQNLDALVCVSATEGTPHPLLEAAACGLPLISTPCGVADELLSATGGGILLPSDPTYQDVVAAFAGLQQQRAQLASMGRRNREQVRTVHQWDFAAVKAVCAPPAVALLGPPGYHGYEHLFLLYSTGIGGVERAVISLLECLPAAVQARCAVLTVTPTQFLPLPPGVGRFFVPHGQLPELLECHGLRTVWIQPLIGILGPFMRALQDRGARVLWLVCSQSPALLAQAAEVSPDVWVSTSPELDELCADQGWSPCARLPHFVASGPPHVSPGQHRLAYVGRNSLEKNSHLLPLALAALPDPYTLTYFVPRVGAPLPVANEQLLVATDGLAHQLKIADRIRYVFDETDPDRIFEAVDVLLLPSWFEGYSLAAHEALVRGIPVVIADHLVLGQEDNLGLVEFCLPSSRLLTAAAAQEMAAAVLRAEALDSLAIATASQHHTREHFLAHHLATLLTLLGETGGDDAQQ